MKGNIFKYLKLYCSAEPNSIDRLIISAFLKKNSLIVRKNLFLKKFVVSEKNANEYTNLTNFISLLDKEIKKFDLETLIELFEFVVSPADRIVNGAIYTPLHIREFITKQSFNSKREKLSTSKISDVSCGCGGFLLTAAQRLKKETQKSYSEIFKKQIFGLDIMPYSITRTKLLLSLLAISEGEDKKKFEFNLFVGDALTFKWGKRIRKFIGFDIILGNPPYVCAKNLSDDVKLNLEKWSVCKSGNPDLYIPFFQIGIENLSKSGLLGFITMNSFFKSLNGRALRDYFQSKKIKFKIIDFGTEQVFKSKNTYTCICLIENTEADFIKYYRCQSKELPQQEKLFCKIDYSRLDSKTGWNLQDNEIISKIESTGISFGELYKTRHGIATLKNDIYIFNPVNEDNDYYYLQNGSLYQIEKGICRDIVNSNKLSRAVKLSNLKEKVIFPYDNGNKPKLLDERYIKDNFPKAYNYLQNKKKILAARDKGKGEYENWFAFGRTQSLEKIRTKMFFPKFSDRTPSFLINSDENMLFYNGLAVVGHSEQEMKIIKKIMESRLFWYYIKSTSKPYSSSYYSLNGNYIRNFGICNLSEAEKEFLINEEDRNALDLFFERKYDVDLSA
ncbi:MAG: N-6 DNA methylase [Bacteroidia bacterium]